MAGLYRKALDYLQARSQLRLVTPDEFEAEEEYISPEDQEAINAQIEQALEKNRMRIDDDTFRVDAERRGGVLPIVVNVVAVLLVAGGLFASLYYFDKKEQEVSVGRQSIASAESRLLDTMAEESERRLSEKNQEITDIQRQLASMISERQSIQSAAEDRIREQEESLRAELERQLAAEKQRLEDGGLSEEDLNRQLNAFETELRSGFDAQLEQAVAQANEEMQERERTLNALISEYEQSLQAAESERSALVEDLEAQRSELQERLAESQSELEGERARFSEQLQNMQAQQNEEQLVLDQLLAAYSGIEQDLSAGDLDSAKVKISDLRAYINDIEISQLPLMQTRRPVELFLIDSLDNLVERELKENEINTESLIESANILASAAALIEQGDSLYRSGSFTEAREKYLDAMAKIPSISRGYASLLEIEESQRLEQLSQIEEAVEEGDSYFLAGEYQSASDSYSRAAFLAADGGLLGATYIERLSETAYRIRGAADAALLAEANTELEDALAREDALEQQVQLQASQNSSALASLNDQIDQLESDKTDLEGERDALSSRIDVLQQEHEVELEAALGVLKTDLALAETEITRLERFEEDAEEREAIASSITDYAQSFSAVFQEAQSGKDDSEVLDLLEIKLAVVTVLSSEEAQKQYPNLTEKMNEYLAALIADNTADTQITTLLELNGLIDHLAREREIDPLLMPEYDDVEQQRLLALFLNKLALLLE